MGSRLEGELRPKPPLRWRLNEKSGSVERIAHRQDSCDAAIEGKSLIQSDGALLIESVEPAGRQTQLALFKDSEWVIETQIGIPSQGCAV